MSALSNSNAIDNGGAYTLSRSLRFRSSASAYLGRTPSVSSNRTTWTWSAWVKRGSLGSYQVLFGAGLNNGTSANELVSIYFTNADQLGHYVVETGVADRNNISTAVYRDPSAWYHIVAVYDSTNATASNRQRLYVNGVQITSWSATSIVSQNYQPSVNSNAYPHAMGKYGFDSSRYLDGYMTEVNFIDGQALTPSSFGATNPVTGVWAPLKYSGTYGTNGFYLPFSNNSTASTLCYDFSGNNNNWAPNNISVTSGTTYDSMTDVPTLSSPVTANYAVLNPLSNGGATISNANLTVTANGATHYVTNSTFQIPTSGKWYWETTASTLGSTARLSTGILPNGTALSGFPYTSSNTYGWYYGDASNNLYWKNNGSDLFNITGAVNDVLQICYDADNGTVYAGKNNVFYNSSGGTTGSPSTLTNPTSTGASSTNAYFPATTVFTAGVLNINFGQRPFTYTPPTGFVALNTYNLPTPTILQGNKYMDATTYTGTAANGNVITNAGGFKPDLVWAKGRSMNSNSNVVDSVRGTTKYIYTSLTDAEGTWTDKLVSFNSNGFTLNSDQTGTGQMNFTNGGTYVAWQWQAGQGTTSSNTNGTITSTVSVNASAGFSIVTYTGTGANATVGHGLGVAPKMIIVKWRSGTYTSTDWNVYHASLGNTNYLALNTTAASTADSTKWNNTSPTSTVFSLGNAASVNGSSSANYVAYCWAEIAGFSKFGSYTGNGSSDGPMVWTGFTPKYILIKSSATANAWRIIDTTRNPYNTANSALWANESTAEATGSTYAIDILSNGFKIRNSTSETNNSGTTMIYAAFASNPFRNSNAF